MVVAYITWSNKTALIPHPLSGQKPRYTCNEQMTFPTFTAAEFILKPWLAIPENPGDVYIEYYQLVEE